MPHITQLEIDNFMKIRAVRINPDGSLVRITGRNAQGKSSILRAIQVALGGLGDAPAEPVRAGEERGVIVCTIGGGADGALTVRRTFTAAGGSSLVVEDAKGARYGSPQAVLNKMLGSLSFDPLAFTRLAPREQAEQLRRLVGLDLSGDDARRAELFVERTRVNRNVEQLRARLDGMLPDDPTTPTAEVSVADLVAEADAANAVNLKIDNVVRELAAKRARADQARQTLERIEASIAGARADLTLATEAAEAFAAKAANLPPKVDTVAIRKRIAGAEEVNVRVRNRAKRAEVDRAHAEARAAADLLTAGIAEVDARKAAALAAARFPVPDLGVGDAGVTLRGLPFAQASSAEQLRASAAICLAANPKLPVLLIRDGSLLDTDGLRHLGEFAEERGAQLWVECVTDGGPVGVVIEDGMVAGEANPYDAADETTAVAAGSVQ